MAIDTIFRVGIYETLKVLRYEVLSAGVHTFKIAPAGNSLLSTIYVRSLDGGATVKAKWYDFGAGQPSDTGARYELGEHDLIDAANTTSRIVVTRIHALSQVDIEVIGGSAEVSFIVSVVSDFPAKIDTSGSDVNTNVVTTPHIDNFTLTNAATEYSYTFPANSRRFTIKNRSGGLVKFAYSAGESLTKYFSIEAGTTYDEFDLKVPLLTIYLQSPSAGQVLEIISWS